MADNTTTNNNGLFSILPVEVRDIIWDFVLEDHQLWVGHTRPRREESGVIRRLISDFIIVDQPAVNYYPPHSLFYVNRSINNEVRQLWQLRFNGTLQIDTRVTHFSTQVYIGLGITRLSLTLAQAADILLVTVPHLHRDAPRFQPNLGTHVPPTTQLVLAQGLNIQHLEIRMRLHFYDGITNLWHSPAQTAFVRLQYFRRSFQVTLRVEAQAGFFHAVNATIGDINNIRHSDFQYYGLEDRSERREFERSVRRFGLRIGHLRQTQSPQYLSLVEAHPRYAFAPLGWRNPGDGEYRYQLHLSPPQNLPPRLAAPRPLDNELSSTPAVDDGSDDS